VSRLQFIDVMQIMKTLKKRRFMRHCVIALSRYRNEECCFQPSTASRAANTNHLLG